MADDYTVTGQRPTTALDGTNQYVDAFEVSFRTTQGGYTGKVTVPVSQYTLDNVKSLIEAQVAQLLAVHNL